MAGLAFAMIEGMDRWVDEIMTDVGCNLELQAEQKHEAANATHHRLSDTPDAAQGDQPLRTSHSAASLAMTEEGDTEAPSPPNDEDAVGNELAVENELAQLMTFRQSPVSELRGKRSPADFPSKRMECEPGTHSWTFSQSPVASTEHDFRPREGIAVRKLEMSESMVDQSIVMVALELEQQMSARGQSSHVFRTSPTTRKPYSTDKWAQERGTNPATAPRRRCAIVLR